MNNLHSGLLYSLTGVTALASMSSCASQKKTEEQKPFNIVYIMTDDHTAQMMSCYDKRYMETPNLDRIANDGVRFTNSFCGKFFEWSQPCLYDNRQAQLCQ